MKKILILLKYNLNRIIIKNPISFIIGILCPVLVALVFMNLSFDSFSTGVKVGIVDSDQTKSSQFLINTLEENKQYKVTIYDNYEKALIEEKQEDIVVEINKNFLEMQEDGIISNYLDNNFSVEGINISLEDTVNNIASLKKSAQGDEVKFNKLIEEINKSDLEIETVKSNDNSGEFMAIQLMIAQILFLMFIKGGNAGEVFFHDKEINIFTRLFTMPIKASYYQIASLLSNTVTLIIQSFATIIIAKLLLRIEYGMSIWRVLLLMIIFSLVVVSFTQLLLTVCKTPQEVSSLNMNILMVWSIIGGAFMPVSIFPDILNKISFLSPIRWAVEYVAQGQSGEGFFRGILSLIIILLFSLVLFLLATYLSKRKEKVYI